MAKSGAERQAEYRARQAQNPEEARLNTVTTAKTMEGLRQLSTRHAVTQRAIIEALVAGAVSGKFILIAPEYQARALDIWERAGQDHDRALDLLNAELRAINPEFRANLESAAKRGPEVLQLAKEYNNIRQYFPANEEAGK